MTEDEVVLAVLREWNFHHSRLGNGYGLSLSSLEKLARGAARALAKIEEEPVRCARQHKLRKSITCTLEDSHEEIWRHENKEIGLCWDEDTGVTIHADLGQVVLVDEQDDEMTDPNQLNPNWRTVGDHCLGCETDHGPLEQGSSVLVPGPSKGLLRCPECGGLYMDRESPRGVTARAAPSGPELAQSIAGPAAEMLETLRIAQQALHKVDDAYPGRLTAALVNWVRPAAKRCEESAASLEAALQVVADRG